MASNALTQGLERFRRHPAVHGSGRFLKWWRDELVGGLPERWRAHLRTEQERLFVRVGEEETVVTDGAGAVRGSFETDGEREVTARAVQGILARSEESRPEVVALVPGERLLQRTVVLPAATADSLRQVLTFEMDRHTPFRADQVYFDHAILETVAGGAKIRVRLYVIRREDGERLLGFCRDRGLDLHGIDVDDGAGGSLGINLLPPAERAARDRRQLFLNLGLALLFLVLLNVVLWQSVAARERALAAHQERLEAVREEAAEVIALREELEETAAAASFLADRKAASPAMLELLDELTRRLPDDTWLQRLQVNGRTLQISGQAPAAAQLIALLEESPCLSAPNIRGAITPDPQTNKERFTIEAEIASRECLHGSASS